MPQENEPERIECSHEGCKSVFHRPQGATKQDSTADIALAHGWTVADEEGRLHCAWGHPEE